MTPEQQKLIEQARRYAEQDDYAITRMHIRNLLAIIEQQRAEHIANSVTVCNVFAAFGERYDERLSPADNVRSLIEQQAASVPDFVKTPLFMYSEYAAEHLHLELVGVIWDVEHGRGFDSVCLQTIKRVSDKLAMLAAAPSPTGLGNPEAPKS